MTDRTNRTHIGSLLFAGGLVAALALALAMHGGPAGAAFPGKNGRIAFDRYVESGDSYSIFTINKDGTGKYRLTANGVQPRFSANGNKVVFLRNRSAELNASIYTMTAGGKKVRRLKNGAGFDPSFSPNGKKIVYAKWLKGSKGPEIFTIGVNGKGRRRLTRDNKFDFAPVWSPGGKWIAFVRETSGGIAIYRMKPNGKSMKRLTGGSNQIAEPNWSPNGRKILYTRNARTPSGGGIFVMKASGKNKRNLTEGRIRGQGPAFSPNGKKIVFTGHDVQGADPETWGIYRMNANGSKKRLILGVDGFSTDWQPR